MRSATRQCNSLRLVKRVIIRSNNTTCCVWLLTEHATDKRGDELHLSDWWRILTHKNMREKEQYSDDRFVVKSAYKDNEYFGELANI